MTLALQHFTNREDSVSSYKDTDEPLGEFEKILIVDDEDIVRHFHLQCLAPQYQCFEADSAEKALEILKTERISLVITDWVMTGMSGTALLRRIVSDFPDTHVVMVTGVDHPERALDAMRSGAFDYILKPSKPDNLEFTVERALKHRRLQIAARQYKIDLELQNIELVKQKAKFEKLQAQIIHTEKMASIGHLTAGIAHELNNPLGYISGNLQLLGHYFRDIRRLLDGYEAVQLSAEELSMIWKIKSEIDYAGMMKNVISVIEDCETGTRKVSEIVENLRVFSKLDQPDFTETDINRDIASVVKLLGLFFYKGNIELTLDYGDLPPIDAYAGHLNQVWMNLLLNAVQAIDKNGGEISIATAVSEGFVTVAISDTGEGISSENLNRIFEPFFTTKAIGHGTGLGLSIVHSIIEEHCGSINVESDTAQGTVITVRLPVKQ